MKLIRTESYEEMSRVAANILAAQITLKPNSVLGLATGSSPVGMYKELIKKYEAGDIDFSDISTVNLDEYKGLTRDNDQSYYYFMNDNLFDHVNIDKARTNVPNGMAEDPEAECVRYESLIKELGGVDLQLLGIGRNGHIGFNEPSDSFDKATHLSDLEESTIEANKRFFASIDDVPRQAFSMGIGTIMSAKKIVVVASGADKADAVKKAFTGPVTPQVPGSILQFHPDVTVICDAEAYSKIEE
ncbi:MAG: glucosamine-6-phosphate deaminase [Tyzzerella sp.]|nr:glucosamine-6-phosphate deaminase [Tyzzerella sp.]